MKHNTNVSVLAIALSLGAVQPALATVSPQTAAAMPKCAVNDQVVLVNSSKKTYTVYSPSSTAQSRREKSNQEAKQNDAQMAAGTKPMCKSAADAMGATMAAGAASPMPMASSSPQ